MKASPRSGLVTLLIGGAILAAAGVVGAIVEWIRLTTPTPMPTLPVGAYTGYHFTPPTSALGPGPLYAFIAVALVGLALVAVGVVRTRTTRA